MKLNKNILIIFPTLIILSLLILLYLEAPNFFRIRNLTNILVQSSALGILAIGMCVVFITGGIDLSLPSNMAFGAIIGSNYIVNTGDPIMGSLIMVLCCFFVGCLNGIAVSYLNMTPFVVTLATMTMLGGTNVWITNSKSVSNFPDIFFDIFYARFFDIPISVFIMFILMILMSLLLNSTKFGRELYYVGINSKASSSSRIDVKFVVFVSYVISGIMAGITAIILTARLGSASANMGSDSVVLDIVSACVVGGISIYGGIGKPYGAILGAIFITLISNSLNQLGISYFINLIIKGLVIIIFIAADNFIRKTNE